MFGESGNEGSTPCALVDLVGLVVKACAVRVDSNMPISSDKVKGGSEVEVEFAVWVVVPCKLAREKGSRPHAGWEPEGAVGQNFA